MCQGLRSVPHPIYGFLIRVCWLCPPNGISIGSTVSARSTHAFSTQKDTLNTHGMRDVGSNSKFSHRQLRSISFWRYGTIKLNQNSIPQTDSIFITVLNFSSITCAMQGVKRRIPNYCNCLTQSYKNYITSELDMQ